MEIIPTQKIVNRDGIKAVKNGQKANQYSSIPNQKKPDWIRVKATFDANFKAVKKQVQDKRLNTVCEEAMCPNISECWSAGTATFMLMGSVCTRACKFCSVDTGNPKGWLDIDEPMHTAKAVKTMGLKYVVLTSVNRDDLEDGGAEHYAQTVKAIKELNPDTAVEALTPDFKGLSSSIDTLVNCGLEVFAQNVETVKRLTHPVRDIRAGYEQTLEVLAESKRINPKVLTKTSLILGLGIPFIAYGIFKSNAIWDFSLLLITGTFLTLIFTALAFNIALSNENKIKGFGYAILLWLFLAVIYDGLFLMSLVIFEDYPLDKLSLFGTMLNPIDLSRTLILLKLDISALLGYTGAVFKKFFGTNFGLIISFIVLIFWVILPVLRITYKSKKKDF